MSVRIIDNDICFECKRETCAYIDVVTKNGTFFSSEGSVCPTGALQSNPAMMQNSPFSKKECINCGLCVGYCNKSNLAIDYLNNDFPLENCNSFGYNALVSNYLNKIFSFASNSNRNSSVLFDGYLEISSEKEAFVEVDAKEPLECMRGLFGDFLMYKGQYADEVNIGLIVLQDIPKREASNIYSVLEKMQSFPGLDKKQIYLSTFSLLRFLFLNPISSGYDFERVFFSPLSEKVEQYKNRLKEEIGFEADPQDG